MSMDPKKESKRSRPVYIFSIQGGRNLTNRPFLGGPFSDNFSSQKLCVFFEVFLFSFRIDFITLGLIFGSIVMSRGSILLTFWLGGHPGWPKTHFDAYVASTSGFADPARGPPWEPLGDHFGHRGVAFS